MTQQQTSGDVAEQTRTVVKKPTQHYVLLHNDDYTTMEFVVEILEGVFHKPSAEAFRLMMQVHTQGQALCGTYPYEIAETKVSAVHERAHEHGFPLRASIEDAS